MSTFVFNPEFTRLEQLKQNYKIESLKFDQIYNLYSRVKTKRILRNLTIKENLTLLKSFEETLKTISKKMFKIDEDIKKEYAKIINVKETIDLTDIIIDLNDLDGSTIDTDFNFELDDFDFDFDFEGLTTDNV